MRKKSKYKPKPVIPDVMRWIKGGMTRAADLDGGSIITRTGITNHLAIEALRRGEASKEDIDTLINAFNVTEALAVMRIGEDYSAEIRAAQDALYQMGVRSIAKGKFLCTGPELVAINLGMEIHDAQLQVCTVAEMEKALDYVWQQIKLKKVRRIPVPVDDGGVALPPYGGG